MGAFLSIRPLLCFCLVVSATYSNPHSNGMLLLQCWLAGTPCKMKCEIYIFVATLLKQNIHIWNLCRFLFCRAFHDLHESLLSSVLAYFSLEFESQQTKYLKFYYYEYFTFMLCCAHFNVAHWWIKGHSRWIYDKLLDRIPQPQNRNMNEFN